MYRYITLILFSLCIQNTFASAIKLEADSLEEGLRTKNKYMVLDKSSLGQPFLLRTAQIQTELVATGNSYQSKIIVFEKDAEHIVMLESPLGRDRTDTFQTKKLLAKFPIIKKSVSTITFDFNEGLKNIFKQSWTDGSLPTSQQGETILNIQESYLNEIGHDKEMTYIDQIVRVSYRSDSTSLRIRYTFSPYKKNSLFQSKESNQLKKVGFFQSPPTYDPKTAKETINIIKIDHNKPRIYYLTSNTPDYLVEAVRDGLNYWNLVFNKRIFKLEKLAEGKSIHDHDINVIQWVNYDASAPAYADVQFDPLTGEALQNNIYIPSLFNKRSQSDALVAIDKKNLSESNHEKSIKLEGFKHSGHECNAHGFTESLNQELVSSLKDKSLARSITEDVIRRLVAHEVGHTLGLRHNFAGSLYSKISIDKKSTVFKRYIDERSVDPKMLPTSSVMDYLTIEDSALAGRLIKNKVIFPYDKKAIDWAYYNKSMADLEDIPFCTDDHAGKFIDCDTYDTGKLTHLELMNAFERDIQNAAYSYIMMFISYQKKTDSFKEMNPIALTPRGAGGSLTNKLKSVLRYIEKDRLFLQIDQEFPVQSSFNEDEYDKRLKELREERYSQLKLFQRVSPYLERKYLQNLWLKSFNKLKETKLNNSIEQLSPSLGNYMNKNAETYFEKMEIFFIEEMVSTFYDVSAYQGVDIEEFEAFLKRLTSILIFTNSDEEITGKNNKNIEFKIKRPLYSLSHRKKALSILSNSTAIDGYLDFNSITYKQVKAAIKKRVESLEALDLPRKLDDFVQKEKSLLNY